MTMTPLRLDFGEKREGYYLCAEATGEAGTANWLLTQASG